jgi:hypothetical protein
VNDSRASSVFGPVTFVECICMKVQLNAMILFKRPYGDTHCMARLVIQSVFLQRIVVSTERIIDIGVVSVIGYKFQKKKKKKIQKQKLQTPIDSVGL